MPKCVPSLILTGAVCVPHMVTYEVIVLTDCFQWLPNKALLGNCVVAMLFVMVRGPKVEYTDCKVR